MSDLLNRAMQRIAREDLDKAEKSLAAEYREIRQKISENPYAMEYPAVVPDWLRTILETPYSGDAGDETE